MGDIRNKLAKIERTRREAAQTDAFLSRNTSYKPPKAERRAVPRCGCGLTIYEQPVMWQFQRKWWEPAIVCCPACIPQWAFQELMACWLAVGIRPQDLGEAPPEPVERSEPMPNPARTVRIHRRADGCLVTRDGQAPESDSPLGVDRNPSIAMGTASREATAISRRERVPVTIEVQQPDGKWKRENVIRPPR